MRLSIGDGVRFGIGFVLAPLILAAIILSCIALAGGFAALFTLLGI